VALPALPCALLIFVVGIAWAVLVADSGTGRWVVVGVMAVLFVLDAVTKYACRAAGCQVSCRARRCCSAGWAPWSASQRSVR